MFEQSDLVVHHLHARSMKSPGKAKGKIGSEEHHTRIVFKSGQVQRIRSCDIQLRLLPHSSRIEDRFEVEVMRKGSVILCPCLRRDECSQQ